ncbi:EthD family reductase [Sinorhizobium sp. 7-81]|uniref:EthD family reductase n=1 Tax=Sinorhizobium sp. 8-89 TaxID=3049089 RepID=UPI0024C381B0|nr:EthD family reductase [Sinorhizobium sp. 8-89]MDK1491864.1 EthD family reductase [Sinorhizobium sp. 8-89]
MIVRQALFEGAVHPGQEGAFRAYVAEKLMPLWEAFPGVREVRVLHAVERDAGATPFAMILSTAYDDREALAQALESPVRYQSREMTKGLLEMFDGHIHHHVFELSQD